MRLRTPRRARLPQRIKADVTNDMKRHPLKKYVLSSAVAYVAGSYAYGVAFMLCTGTGFSPAQIALLAASPIWLLLHVPLTVVCTLRGWHGSWNADNTVSSISFAGAALVAWFVMRTFQNRNKNEPNQASEVTARKLAEPHRGRTPWKALFVNGLGKAG